MGEEWLTTNQAYWDERAPLHTTSDFYDVPRFKAGATSLRPFEIAEMGHVAGKRLVHLQCHFGQDTLSWARLGATVTGLDFAPSAVAAARALATELGVAGARFVQSNVYDAPAALGERFDIVYTGLGVLGWLPDIGAWARVVADLLPRRRAAPADDVLPPRDPLSIRSCGRSPARSRAARRRPR